jgi:hypothetical protein
MKTTTQRQGQRGFALAAVFLVLLLASGITAAIHAGVLGDTFASGAHHRATAAFYAAESGINRGMADYRNIFLNSGVPSGSDFDPHSFALGHRDVTYQLTEVPGNPRQVIIPAGRPFNGLSAIEYSYIARSISELTAGEEEASVGTQFNVDNVPLFQFLAFYQNDLEILPGAAMNLHGPIHTNGRLYFNSDNTLTINELTPTIPTVHISAASGIYRGRKDNTATCGGTVRIARLTDANNDGALDLSNIACGSGTTQMSSASIANWLGALAANQPTVEVPTPDVLEHGTGDFWRQADLRIALDRNNQEASGLIPIVVQDIDGNTDAALTARLQLFMIANPGRIFYNAIPDAGEDAVGSCPTTGANTYCDRRSYTPQFGADNRVYACAATGLNLYPGCAAYVANEVLGSGQVTARRGGFYNNREGQWVQMLNVNVRDLLVWNRAQPSASQLFDPDDATQGGVVLFLSVDGPGSGIVSSPRYGVRVFGSPNLDFPGGADMTGISIASDQAIYVEGNYNNGTGVCTFGACPKAPAALMGDTLNVLSAGWSGNVACRNDCQSRQPLASRIAASTTLNAALIGGVPATTPGNYNGGFENYPRFHERWTGRTLTYRGSFVSLGEPRHNNGGWVYGGTHYEAPARNWDYDTDFQDVAFLPPITPTFVSVEQILFTENFR